MKQSIRRLELRGVLPQVLAGVIVYAGLTLLGAELMRRGLIPMEYRQGIATVSLVIGAVVSGACCGRGGRRSIIVGAVLCMLYLIGKGIAPEGMVLSANTLIGAAICLLLPVAGSCIFHKKRSGYTDRNRRKRAR